MALEGATYINQLVVTNPDPFDPKGQGDDHIRLIKRTLKQTFPSITGPVYATQDHINAITSPGALAFPGMIVMWSGAITSIPAGWKLCNGVGTISTGAAVPNLVDRFIIGSATNSGGSYNVNSTGGSTSHIHDVLVAGHVLTEAQIPAHRHDAGTPFHSNLSPIPFGTSTMSGGRQNSGTEGSPAVRNAWTSTVGGNQPHSHGAVSNWVNHMPPYYALAFIIKN